MRRRATALVFALMVSGCLRPTPQPDVVLIMVDTLRPDHLGAYGYARPTSPHIDALAARATLFENAISQAPHTIPSMLQIMTSRYAQGLQIPPGDRTLAEVLQSHGYQTLAVVANPHFALDRTAHGLKRGFERFYRNGVLSRDSLAQQLYKADTTADSVTAQALRVLRGRRRGQPFFLWVHYLDPHDPYLPPFDDDMDRLSQESTSAYTGDVRATPLYKQSRESPAALAESDREHLIELYDAEVRHVDQSLADLLGYLESERVFDRAVVVLASDHGESLGEHDIWTHGQSCFDPEIRIPLLVKTSHQHKGDRRREAVQAIDIFPTVVEALGWSASDLHLDGESLLRAHTQPAFVFWQDWQVARTPEWKLVQQGASTHLYRVDRDPQEREDVLKAHADVARGLVAARTARLQGLGPAAADLERQSSAAVERLRALGYLGP